MQGSTDETVGEAFHPDLLKQARDMTLEVILKASQEVVPGMTESEARTLVSRIQTEMGGSKSWHPPQIRFGRNSTLAFGQRGEENVALAKNDIYFFDIGPIFHGHEGDVGRPFTVGQDPEMAKCCKDAGEIWLEVRDHWAQKGVTGAELYAFARLRTVARGWLLTLEKANGHRIADFPHAARNRGSIEGFDQNPAANRWILEIQIRHPHKPFGAFYEDLLN